MGREGKRREAKRSEEQRATTAGWSHQHPRQPFLSVAAVQIPDDGIRTDRHSDHQHTRVLQKAARGPHCPQVIIRL